MVDNDLILRLRLTTADAIPFLLLFSVSYLLFFPFPFPFLYFYFFFSFFLLAHLLLVYCVVCRVYDHNGKITCTYRSSTRPYFPPRIWRKGNMQGDGITTSGTIRVQTWSLTDKRRVTCPTLYNHHWLTTPPAHPGLLTCHKRSRILRLFIIFPCLPPHGPIGSMPCWGLRHPAFPLLSLDVRL